MQTFETDQPIAVSIELSQATVRITASDRSDTAVTVGPTDPDRSADVDAAAKTTVDLTNGTLAVRMPKPGGLAATVVGWKRSGSVDVTVEVPERSSFRADTGVADIRCDGLLGDVDVKAGAGAVRIDRAGSLRVRTGVGAVAVEDASGVTDIVAAGDISVGGVGDAVTIKNRTGRTWLGRVDGQAWIKSANGDVTIDDAGGDVTVKTACGSIRLGRVAQGSVNVETAAGGLAIGIKHGTAAWIDATTKFGRVDNRLTPSDHPDPSAETVQVHARTSFGDVTIERS